MSTLRCVCLVLRPLYSKECVQDDTKATPLMRAAFEHADVSVVRLLIELKANIVAQVCICVRFGVNVQLSFLLFRISKGTHRYS